METFRIISGTTPLLLSVPHCGTHLPAALAARLTEPARTLPDTDWHVDRLVAFAPRLGAGLLTATHSRYVADLNRDPSGAALYAGADNTEIVPTATFDRAPIWVGGPPDRDAVVERIETYWRPYHDRLYAELARLRVEFGFAVLLDMHSIRSRLPRFFEGELPHLNLGSADGRSADPALIDLAWDVCIGATAFSAVRDGRFKGGYITRRYGDPAKDVHALQLEIAQRSYLDEHDPTRFDPDRAAALAAVLERLVQALLAWTQTRRPINR